MPNSIDHGGLVALIERMIAEQQSGTLIIRDQSGHAIMIAVEHGRLISLSASNKRGTDALPSILEFASGTYSLNPLVLGHAQEDLPDTAALLEVLHAGGSGVVAQRPAAQRPAAAGGAPKATARAVNPAAAKSFEDGVARLLIDYLGPIGPLLCENTVESIGGIKSVRDAETLLQRVGEEISEEKERQVFFLKANKLLAASGI
jgi:hypothetical protein